MTVVYVVLARPWTHPGELEFLAAYSTRSNAEEFVQIQDAAVRDCLIVWDAELDKHPSSDGFWKIPGLDSVVHD
jgi:hypothetical protein